MHVVRVGTGATERHWSWFLGLRSCSDKPDCFTASHWHQDFCIHTIETINLLLLDFLQTWELFTCLFSKMQKSHYLNWKGTEKKQDKMPCNGKVLSNPTDGCPAMILLCFLFQWGTPRTKRASLHDVQTVVIACWLCGNFLKSGNNACGSLTRAISTLEYITVYNRV